MNYNLRALTRHIILSLLLFLCFIMPTQRLYAQEKHIIKVGYPLVKDFTDKKGELYTGYVYDYLREIALYTEWEYEWIEMELETAIDALLNGEIDLLAGILKNEETMALFDFTTYDIGALSTTLSVIEGSPYLEQSKYAVLDGIRVGYDEASATDVNNFIEFCKTNGIKDAQLIPYPHTQDRDALMEALKSHKVDAVLGNDLTRSDSEEVIARFAPVQHFLATTKGNTTLIKELDRALSRIKHKTPDFEKTLCSKYFEDHYYQTLILSKEQQDYLSSLPPLKAIYINNYIPIQYYDEKEEEAKGMFVDAARLLAQILGISLEFIPVESYEEAYELIKAQEADIIIGLVDDYLIADQHDLILTPHYMTLQLAKAVNMHHQPIDEVEIVALPKGHGNFTISGKYEIRYYDTLEACLQAVNEGKADATYSNVYSLSNYLTHESYNHLTIVPNIYSLYITFGLSSTLDPALIEILHKAIYYLPENQLVELVMTNNFEIRPPINFKLFFYNNMTLCLWVMGIILGLVAISSFIYIQLLYNKMQIDALTGIYNRGACERLSYKYLKTKKYSSYTCFIIIDMDHFKQINDRFGHKKGDQLLIQFSNVLKKTFPKNAILSRLGGDEFIVLIKNIDECQIHLVNETLDTLCKTMHKSIEHEGHTQEISLSIGAILTHKALPFTQLYTAADELLYEVKRNGRNGYKVKLYE